MLEGVNQDETRSRHQELSHFAVLVCKKCRVQRPRPSQLSHRVKANHLVCPPPPLPSGVSLPLSPFLFSFFLPLRESTRSNSSWGVLFLLPCAAFKLKIRPHNRERICQGLPRQGPPRGVWPSLEGAEESSREQEAGEQRAGKQRAGSREQMAGRQRQTGGRESRKAGSKDAGR